MIWATVSSLSCFCWLYTASPSLAAKNIINLILVLTIWWCPCVHLSTYFAAAAAKLLQSCPTLCDPIDGSPPGPAFPGSLQARTLEWVAISSSKAWKWKVKVKLLSCVWLLATPWTAAYQAPPSMGFAKQEYWSGLPLPSLLLSLLSLKFQFFFFKYTHTHTHTHTHIYSLHARDDLLFLQSYLKSGILSFI